MSRSLAVPIADVREVAVNLLVAAGAPAAFARTVAEALVDADIEGLASHGIMLLPMYTDRMIAGSVIPKMQGRVISDTGTQIVIDADNGLGQIVAEKAIGMAVDRAREHGLAAVAVRNAFHFGAAGRFARSMALQGCAGIVMANTRPLLPAPGGAERVVGNNPIAMAVPTGAEPIVIDLALSAGAMGKIRLAESQGQKIPPGWAATSDGMPTVDPSEAIKGMLLPAAGPKGFGLAVMIDLLAGGLSSGAIGDAVQPLYGDLSKPYGCSNLFIAINVEGFRPVANFEQDASRFADKVRTSRRAPGSAEIRMPGDRAARAHRDSDGTVTIATATLASLRASALRLNVTLPSALSN